jgi:hypothetical protein
MNTFFRGIAAFLVSLGHRFIHRFVFKNSFTYGTVEFYGFSESPKKPVDGHVIVHDDRFKSDHICGFRFENRHIADRTPQEQCLAVWQELMSMDGVRPLALVTGDRIFTPYGPSQPIPRRFKKLYDLEQERSKNIENAEAMAL